MATHYSKYFGITHKDLVGKGVYNGYVDKDSLLHVDPLLLKGCTIPEFRNAYEDFLQYFRGFVSVARFVKQANDEDRFFVRMVKRFELSEIPNTGLGYSVSNTKGRGISGALALQLAHSAYEIIQAGLIDPEIFGLMQLIEDNMGADRISDMTLAILQDNVLSYTQRIAAELELPTMVYKTYNVPFYRNKPIHFIPMCILADLPIAHDYDDIDKVCNYNSELKKRVADIIGVSWAEYKEYKKPDWRNIILNNKQCYDSVINFYKGITGVAYDFGKDCKEQYQDVLLEEFLQKFPFSYSKPSDSDVKKEVYDLAMAICLQFKHLVEDNRLSEQYYRKSRMPDEKDWQMLLYAVADTYKVAGNLDVSITREDNPGVGQIDFHITRGAKANTIIEIKRSSNDNLLHGYRSQLAGYIRADRADSGIFMVIMEDDGFETIKAKIENVQKDMKEKGEYISEVIYVNGIRQPSASSPDYDNPSLDKLMNE